MFEIIGLLFATALLFVVSSIIGAAYAAVAFLILWQRPKRRLRKVLVAATIPIISAAYLWLCTALLPGQTLFGDISQPLPNGYSLQALGKMPDFAYIVRGSSFSGRGVNLTELVGSLAVQGPLVIGRYSHPAGEFYPHPNENYFVFDTTTETVQNYASLDSLTARLGQPVKLVSTERFNSQESSYLKQQRSEHRSMFLPPLIASVAYTLFLVHLRFFARDRSSTLERRGTSENKLG